MSRKLRRIFRGPRRRDLRRLCENSARGYARPPSLAILFGKWGASVPASRSNHGGRSVFTQSREIASTADPPQANSYGLFYRLARECRVGFRPMGRAYGATQSIMFIAGEASGDAHASRLIGALR